MPVNLSIKNVPDDLAERLRQRAKRNHRSLQGELMAIVQQAALDETALERKPMTIRELADLAKASGFRTPASSAEIIREDRAR